MSAITGDPDVTLICLQFPLPVSGRGRLGSWGPTQSETAFARGLSVLEEILGGSESGILVPASFLKCLISKYRDAAGGEMSWPGLLHGLTTSLSRGK